MARPFFVSQLQAVALIPLPVTVNESMFANPPLVVATSAMSFAPARNAALTEPEFVHVVQAPVAFSATVESVVPFTRRLPGRLPVVPLAKRHCNVKFPAAVAFTRQRTPAFVALLVLAKPAPV